MRIKIIFLIFIFIFIYSGTGILGKTIINYAILAPKSTLWGKSAQAIKSKIYQATGGEVDLKISYGTKGTETTMVQLLKTGEIDMASFTGIGMGQIVGGIRVMELPMFFSSDAQVDKVRHGLTPYFKKKFLKYRDGFIKKGFRFLGWGEVGWIYLFTKEKVTSLKDFQGMRVWSPNRDIMVRAMLTEMEVLAESSSIPSVYPKLQSGRLGAVLGSTTALVVLQWHNYVNYVVKVRLARGTGGTIMRQAAWERIPKVHRDKIADIIWKSSETLVYRVRAENKRHIRTIANSGIKGISLTPDQKKLLLEKAVIVQNKMIGKLFSNSLLQKAKSLK